MSARVRTECGLAYLSEAYTEMRGEVLDVKEYAAGYFIDGDVASRDFLREIALLHREQLPEGRMTSLRRHRDALAELVGLITLVCIRGDLPDEIRDVLLSNWRTVQACRLLAPVCLEPEPAEKAA
ncbi:MAG TPA: hypothetical protein VFB37_16975 [Steroidobacteraceae bacterium]|nr:hypothetical protein [Steroidobacteraceae bacterium]